MKKAMKKLEALLELGGMKKDIIFLVISGIALVLSILKVIALPFDMAWVAIILCGIQIILEAIIGLVTEFDIKADVLVSLALIASVFIGEDFAAGEVAFIMQLGGLLEELTVARARAGIEKLVHLTPQTARLIQADGEKIIAAQDVKVGDLLRVLPGETVPVDGVITSGQTSVNQAVMTGESLPVDKTAGDEVASGTVNQFGVFEMKAVTILVVFCPCAMVLATPTAIMAAIGNATKHGFLVRQGDALERLASVDKITFDKTGTLTYGTPQVTAVESLDETFVKEEIYRLTAAVEQMSEHPLGKAMVRSYKAEQKKAGREAALPQVEAFEMLPGRGVYGIVEGKKVLAGNEKLLAEQEISITTEGEQLAATYSEQGCTVIYTAVDGKFAGITGLSDTIRKESKAMLGQLKKLGVEPVLLTGDHENAASTIAGQLQISKVYANCLPEDKLNHIREYQARGEKICMIGDGINDAPALKCANVGIAMGVVGSDIAVDAADIALVDDEVKEIPHLVALAKRMMITIKCNLSFSMGLNFVAIVLAITGILNPVVGALVHNAGSVLVIINSAFLLKWKMRK
ncbi:cation-translocating P-type ATPase [Bacteroides xylanolyticus]|uniref:Cd(2+)-exporting ATPase n=2 Tax=Lacrimispora defluvii TaxID=2719233 RepID=A0ABX1VM99_9FIRM|nr:cation-translocating P-type ATPase [Lacrimispora defluvii]NNJ29010.1 cation-translocating P-type ATPase [Lacrimispora defluvii]